MERIIPMTLTNGLQIKFETVGDQSALVPQPGAAAQTFAFDHVTDAIEGVAGELQAIWDKVSPDTLSVEFGVSVEVESGALTALIVKGTANANLKVTLEWKK